MSEQDLGDAFAAHADEALAIARGSFPAATEAWPVDGELCGVRVASAWIDQAEEARHGIPLDPGEARRILDYCHRDRPCNDCGAPLGQPHGHGCDVECCQHTGGQWIVCGGYSGGGMFHQCQEGVEPGYDANGHTIHTCDETPHDCGSETWDGVWPGVEEAVGFGRYSLFAPPYGWVRCGPEAPGAGPDLNRVHGPECRWDREAGRWVLRVPAAH